MPKSLLGRRVDAFCELAPGFLVTGSRLGEGDVGIDSQGERFLFPVDTVVVAPVPTAVWLDQQVQAPAVTELPRPTQGLCATDSGLGQHLSSGAVAVAETECNAFRPNAQKLRHGLIPKLFQ